MPPTVTLELMPRQLEAKAFGDDWTGVTSTAERRKRQNRLHQRAYRMSRTPSLSLPVARYRLHTANKLIARRRKEETYSSYRRANLGPLLIVYCMYRK